MIARIDTFTKEEFAKIVKESSSIDDVRKKLGYASKSGKKNAAIKAHIEEFGLSTSHFSTATKSPEKRNNENVFTKSSTADQKTLRKYFLKGGFREYKCSVCGQLPVWNGMELTLILDHINGQNHDNRLENLRWVCPNCNQQLDTTGSKNIVKKKREVQCA